MRSILTSVAVVGCLAVAGVSQGAVIAQYNFETAGTASTPGATGPNSGDTVVGLTGVTDYGPGPAQLNPVVQTNYGISDRGDTSTGSQASSSKSFFVRGRVAQATTLADAITGDQYSTFSFTIAPNFTLNLSGLTFAAARDGSTASPRGPKSVSVLTSVGGFANAAASIGNYTVITGSGSDADYQDFDVTSIAGTAFDSLAAGTYQFRFYVFGGADNGDPLRVDNVVLSGTVAPAVGVPEPASLSLLGLAAAGLLRRRRRS